MADRHFALEAILSVRYRAAASFEPGFTGVRGQAYDRAVLDCFGAVERAIAAQGMPAMPEATGSAREAGGSPVAESDAPNE